MTTNRTSAAVDEILLSSTTNRKKVALAEKYKRMEEALRKIADLKSELSSFDYIDIARSALAFDPLSA